MKYGLERQNHPPIVIAKPIPPPEPTSAPPPSAVKFSESRKKAVARKRANKGATSTESVENEEETPSDQAEQEIPSVQAEQEIPSVQAIPILKEVKLEIEDMLPEEFERYVHGQDLFWSDGLPGC